MKLVELAIVQIIGNVEDEICFSTLTFMKSKLCNRFIIHLPIVVHMFAQQFYTLEKFSYVECIEQWRVACHQFTMMVGPQCMLLELLALFMLK